MNWGSAFLNAKSLSTHELYQSSFWCWTQHGITLNGPLAQGLLFLKATLNWAAANLFYFAMQCLKHLCFTFFTEPGMSAWTLAAALLAGLLFFGATLTGILYFRYRRVRRNYERLLNETAPPPPRPIIRNRVTKLL